MQKYENKIWSWDIAVRLHWEQISMWLSQNFCCFKSNLNQNQNEVLSLHDKYLSGVAFMKFVDAKCLTEFGDSMLQP